MVAAALTLPPTSLSGTSVLMYHSVAELDGGFITDTPEDFERHMRFIKEHGYRTVFASEIPGLLAKGDLANTVCVTLDDGYRDNYENAFPVLKKYGIKATVFVITGLVDGAYTDSRGTTRAIMTEEQIREMAASRLVEFMPHTHTHPDLPDLDAEGIEREVTASKAGIERLTGKQANVFAYPRGKYNGRVIEALKQQGFVAAFGVEPGIVRAGTDPFRIPRIPLGDISDTELALKLSDRLDTYLALKRHLPV